MVREYGVLQDVILELVQEGGPQPELRELRLLADCIMTGAVDSVDQYVLLRDKQLREQSARHLGFIAHELRNPLQSALLGFAALKESGLAVAGRIAEAVERSHGRLRELIDNTILEARLTDGVALSREEIDLSALLDEVCLESAGDAEARAVAVHTRVAPGLCFHGDRKLLRSAFSNLLRNAIKFSRKGGSVEVRAHAEAERLLLEFEDSCGGLPEGKIQDLFDPYVQAGNDRSGFGLGLAIAKQATEAHGGDLRVTNLPAKGCVFMLDLPRR